MSREASYFRSITICLLLFTSVYFANIFFSDNNVLDESLQHDSAFNSFVFQKTRLAFVSIGTNSLKQIGISQQVSDHKVLAGLNAPTEYNYRFRWDEPGLSDQLILKKKSTRLVTRSNNSTNTIDGLEFVLKNGQLLGLLNNKTYWRSSPKWWVDSYAIFDSDNDGLQNINMSVWKSGSFGSSMPFWIKLNDDSIKNHFFVYKFSDGKMTPAWQSSNLTAPNCEFTFADIDNEGKNELVVIEGNYYQWPDCEGEYVAVWRWNGWGFSNEWRSEKGRYRNLHIYSENGRNIVVVESY